MFSQLSVLLMFNLTTFKKLLIAALCTGLLAGLLLTAIQQLQVIPTLQKAEVYEQNTVVITKSNHVHEWQPEIGWERIAYTTATNISLGISFALLMGAIMHAKGQPNNWRVGLLWGLAGYLSFFLAPSLGLPPEAPGTLVMKWGGIQNWWFITVLDTGFGLSLLAFAKTRTNQFFGAVLLATPHLIGAPQPEVNLSAAPPEFTQSFIIATAFSNAVFWLTIGSLMGKFYKKTS
jgi:cobalt transporter subunit CbtA